MKHEKLVKAFMDFLDKNFGDVATEEVHQEGTQLQDGVEVQKSVHEEERRALFVALAPQFDDGTTEDLHGDWYSTLDVAKACRSYNKHSRKAGLGHKIELSDEHAVVEQSYLAPTNFTLNTPNGDVLIRKGTWLMEWHFPELDLQEGQIDLWKSVITGDITGISIQCSAMGTTLEDE
tara:strand:- start:64496 stop:65026 length:531 start_codon:yes stop_codon:yes gene_type:complete